MKSEFEKRILLPSMLSADFASLGQELEKLESMGVKAVHLDVMDGAFVPNITFGPPVIKAMRPHFCGIFDVHLMIERPSRYVDQFIDAGADFLTLHAESELNLIRTLKMVEKAGVRPGVSINPETPIEAIRHFADHVDLILVMTVNPGFGGQSFMPLFDKIRAASELVKRPAGEELFRLTVVSVLKTRLSFSRQELDGSSPVQPCSRVRPGKIFHDSTQFCSSESSWGCIPREAVSRRIFGGWGKPSWLKIDYDR